MNIRKFFEYAYLAIAVFSIYEAVKYWQTDNSRSFWLYVVFALVALLMFFVRRRARLQGKK